MSEFGGPNKYHERLIGIVLYIITFGFFMAVPLILSRYIMGLITISILASICAMSYNLLMGYAGLLSFGHVIGWGIGAYTVGMLAGKGITGNFWIILILALLVTIIVSAIFGFLALRTREVYFALITLAMAEIMRALVLKGGSLTGGDNGLTDINRPWSLEDVPYYYFVLVGFFLCFFLIRWLISSWYGKVLVGIRENEPRMLMLGYHTWLFKYFTFIITQLIAAIAGLLSCYYRGIAAPDDFSFITMGSFILMVLIGGQRTMVGPIIGAFFVTFITHYLSSYTNEWMGILGIIFIIVVMFAQKGIGGYLTEWYHMIQSKMIKQ